MANRPQLAAQKREVLGRKVKKLRKEGLIPAHVYGKGVKSVHLCVEGKTFLSVFKETGETGLVDLVVGREKPRVVLISQTQRHPLTGETLHVDFHQVTLTEKVTAEIPVEIVGESPAVNEKRGVLLTILDAVEVEALPTDLPERIKIDASGLKEVGDAVKVGEAKVGDKVKILADAEEILIKIGPLVTKEAEEEIKAEEEAVVEVEEAKKEVEEGEPAEKPEPGATPEDKPKEKKKGD